jgi:hypothetical protein
MLGGRGLGLQAWAHNIYDDDIVEPTETQHRAAVAPPSCARLHTPTDGWPVPVDGSERTQLHSPAPGTPKRLTVATAAPNTIVKPRASLWHKLSVSVQSAVRDVRQFNELPFNTAIEKCHFIVARDGRGPYLSLVLIVLVALALGVAFMLQRKQHTQTVAFRGGGSVVSTTSSGLFRLVPV